MFIFLGGAKITGMEVDGCDSTTTGRVYVDLRQVSWLGNLNTLATVESGTSNTPGCYYWFKSKMLLLIMLIIAIW